MAVRYYRLKPRLEEMRLAQADRSHPKLLEQRQRPESIIFFWLVLIHVKKFKAEMQGLKRAFCF